MSSGLHIALNAETLFDIGPLSFSNSMLTSTIVTAILIIFAIAFKLNYNPNTIKPTGIQNFAEWIIESLFNFMNTVTGDLKKTKLFLPPLATFFLFILLNNWLGLFPGVGSIGVNHTTEVKIEESVHAIEQAELSEPHSTFVPIFRPGTADLNTTIALALFSVTLVQIIGYKHQRLHYFNKFINFSNPINFYVGILEIISEFAKIISFAFRLFGNVFAGEVLIVVIAYLTKIVVPVPFYGLEIFVGFIQALVFTMLSLVFYNMATAKSH